MLTPRELQVVQQTYHRGKPQSARAIGEYLGIPLTNVAFYQAEILRKLQQKPMNGVVYNNRARPSRGRVQAELVRMGAPNTYLLNALGENERRIYYLLTEIGPGGVLRHNLATVAEIIGTDVATIHASAKRVRDKLRREPDSILLTGAGEISRASRRGLLITSYYEDNAKRLVIEADKYGLLETLKILTERGIDGLYRSQKQAAEMLGITEGALKSRIKKLSRLIVSCSG